MTAEETGCVFAASPKSPTPQRAGEFVRSGQLLLEQRHVPVECAHADQCPAGTSARKRQPFSSKSQPPSARENSRATFRKLYPKCENISVDYAVLEPRSAKGEQASNIFCLPADFGWNDLGSWTALHEHHVAKTKPADENVISSRGQSSRWTRRGNYVHAPGSSWRRWASMIW